MSLSNDGSTALVGGAADDDPSATGDYGTGAAWVFTRTAGMWSQQGPKLVATDGSYGDEFSRSVAVSGAAARHHRRTLR